MTKLKIMIVGLLLTVLFSSAQTTYPIQQVINNDTVILITPLHLKYVNRQILTVDYLTKANKTLLSANVNLSNQIDLWMARASSLSIQNEAYKQSSLAYSGIIEDKQDELSFNKKLHKKKKRKAIFVSGGIGVALGLIISILL